MSSDRARKRREPQEAPAERSGEHNPVLDPQRENGLLAMLSDAKAPKLCNSGFAFVWGTLEAVFAISASIILHRFVIAAFDTPIYQHMKATTPPNKCPPSPTSDLSFWLRCHYAADFRYFAFDVPRIFGSTAILLSVLLVGCAFFFHLSPFALLKRMGLGRPRLSGTFAAVAALLALELAAMYAFQEVTGEYVLTLENLTFRDDGHLAYGRVLDMLIVTPIREEIVYRGLVLHIIFNRFHARGPAVALASALFGAVHLMNLAAGHLSPAYIFMQVLLGTLIGAYYGARLLLTGSLHESIALHIVNNLCSVFIPFRFSLDDPLLVTSLSLTFLFYSVALIIDVRRLRSAGARTKAD